MFPAERDRQQKIDEFDKFVGIALAMGGFIGAVLLALWLFTDIIRHGG